MFASMFIINNMFMSFVIATAAVKYIAFITI